MTELTFQNPWAWWLGLPLGAAILVLFARALQSKGHDWKRQAVLLGLRGAAALLLLFLAARPMWVNAEDEEHQPRDRVALMFDRSQSMSLLEGEQSRYQQAVDFARDSLLPALQNAELKVEPFLFDEEAVPASGEQLAHANAAGPQTDLGTSVTRVLLDAEQPPLAVIALTDGVATKQDGNARATSLLVDEQVRFIGVGFGSERGTRLLSLDDAVAPARAAPDQPFRLSAQLHATGDDEIPAFDLVLLRDGEFVAQKTVPAFRGARNWQESFSVEESEEKLHQYTVQLLPPSSPGLTTSRTQASVNVRVTDEKELRVLFVQGGLTWDYKFIRLALSRDPSIRFSGLSRSSGDAAFFENVENDEDLLDGFPSSIERLTRFQIVVLSNLHPRDLTTSEQKLLTQFCGDYGGGVLMIGGAETFDSAWIGTDLERLLPVRFAPFTAPDAGQAPFRIRLSDAAREHPVFQLEEGTSATEAWNSLPAFQEYAAVDELKPGAQVWLEGSVSRGGKYPVLMASQRFGSGVSSVICLQTFWRWRLAKESRTELFDRFWQQLFRYLSEGGRDRITIQLRDQEMLPRSDIRLLVERRTTAASAPEDAADYVFRVTDDENQVVSEQRLQLAPGQFEELQFRAAGEGLYTAAVLDHNGVVQATRSIDLHETLAELVQTSRDMAHLRQWANLSGGFALPVEECLDCSDIVSRLKEAVDTPGKGPPRITPAGINGWMMTLLLGCVCGEWLLRKRWNLV